MARTLHPRPGSTVLLEVGKVEAMYGEGRYEEAIAVGESLRPNVYRSAGCGLLCYWVGMSYLQLARPQRGKELLAEARAHFEAAGDRAKIVDCMNGESSVALLEQRADAVPLAERALAACRALREIPDALEMRILGTLGAAHIAAGEWADAISVLDDARPQAGSLFDMRQQAKLFTNLAIAHEELGQPAQAIGYCVRAVALLETLRDQISLARAENNLGWLLVGCGDLVRARVHLIRSLDLLTEAGTLSGRGSVLHSLTALCFAEGEPAQAAAFANEALASSEQCNEGRTAAEARIMKARIAERQGDDVEADRQFELALQLLDGLGNTARAVVVRIRYAAMLESRGELQRAYGQLKAAYSIRQASVSLAAAPQPGR